MKFKKWLDRGDGGEWYESHVTNLDLIRIGLVTILGMGIIIIGCYFISNR